MSVNAQTTGDFVTVASCSIHEFPALAVGVGGETVGGLNEWREEARQRMCRARDVTLWFGCVAQLVRGCSQVQISRKQQLKIQYIWTKDLLTKIM
jgi:hypothetical protein